MMLESMLWLNTPSFVARFLEDTVLPAVGAPMAPCGPKWTTLVVVMPWCPAEHSLEAGQIAKHAAGAALWGPSTQWGAVAEGACAQGICVTAACLQDASWTTVSQEFVSLGECWRLCSSVEQYRLMLQVS